MDNFHKENQENSSTRNVDAISIVDATIERVFTRENARYVTISHVTKDQYSAVRKNFITLAVGPDTLILNPLGNNLPFSFLRRHLIVDVDLSAAMTFSIPPQARAFRIIVSYRNWPSDSRLAKVLEVDINNRFLYTGNADDINSQIRFVINNSTQILDRRGRKIRLEDLKPDQVVRIAHATFMTNSIPPQTTAFRIQTI